MVDRFDDALQISQQSIATAQRERQDWALNIFEAGRGRQLLEMGLLPDASAALGGRFTVEIADKVVSVLDAAGVVALGRVAIHTGDSQLTRQAREIAHAMFDQGPPSVRRHADGGTRCLQWPKVIRSAHIVGSAREGRTTDDLLCLDFRWVSPTTWTWFALHRELATLSWPGALQTQPFAAHD